MCIRAIKRYEGMFQSSPLLKASTMCTSAVQCPVAESISSAGQSCVSIANINRILYSPGTSGTNKPICFKVCAIGSILRYCKSGPVSKVVIIRRCPVREVPLHVLRLNAGRN